MSVGFAVLFLALFAGLAASDPCTSGGVCCANCNTQCAGNTLACFSNCISPCTVGKDCVKKGNDIAKGVAASACDMTKADCGVFFGRGSQDKFFVDLTGCCEVIIGSCQGNAAKIECDPGEYGHCGYYEFQKKYQAKIASECKNAVCWDAKCKDALKNSPRCK